VKEQLSHVEAENAQLVSYIQKYEQQIQELETEIAIYKGQ
jgi:hypothetical protein